MTLRQQYAGPRPRAIAITGTSRAEPQLPLTSAHRDQPTPSAWPTHATAAATQPANGRPSPSPRPRLELCPPLRACHRLNLLAWQCKSGHSSIRSARHGKLPLQPAPVTAGAYHRRPACALRRWIPV